MNDLLRRLDSLSPRTVIFGCAVWLVVMTAVVEEVGSVHIQYGSSYIDSIRIDDFTMLLLVDVLPPLLFGGLYWVRRGGRERPGSGE